MSPQALQAALAVSDLQQRLELCRQLEVLAAGGTSLPPASWPAQLLASRPALQQQLDAALAHYPRGTSGGSSSGRGGRDSGATSGGTEQSQPHASASVGAGRERAVAAAATSDAAAASASAAAGDSDSDSGSDSEGGPQSCFKPAKLPIVFVPDDRLSTASLLGGGATALPGGGLILSSAIAHVSEAFGVAPALMELYERAKRRLEKERAKKGGK